MKVRISYIVYRISQLIDKAVGAASWRRIVNKFCMSKKSFTLIEVMVATAVLSLGIVLIYEIFFKSLDISNYCSNYLNVVSRADERMWQAQDDLSRFGAIITASLKDEFTDNNEEFFWNLSYQLLDAEAGLYRIEGTLSWEEGLRKKKISRVAYALYREREEDD